MFSYDWLKIVATVVAAVFAMYVLFTTVRARPRDNQKFGLHGYGGLIEGEDNYRLSETLDTLFSYDILQTTCENFEDDTSGPQVFSARRTVAEGTVVFAANYTSSTEEGARTPLQSLALTGLRNAGTPEEKVATVLDLGDVFSDTEEYFARFFGENWRETDTLDEAAVRTYFAEVQKKDKRFRSAANKEKGILMEGERLKKLRDDYLFVLSEGFEAGKLSITYVTTQYTVTENGEEKTVEYRHPVGINVGALSRVSKIFRYPVAEGGNDVSELNMLFYNNGEISERNMYEAFTLLRYLLENYA